MAYLDPPFNTGIERRRGALGYDDAFADYAGFLAPRLQRVRELLAPHGTLYLHLDYREAHRAKLALDELFGPECFLNELIWIYDYGGRPKRRWPAKHDTILVYVRDRAKYHFDDDEVDREPYMAPGLVGPEKAARGKRPSDCWWHTIVPTNSREKTGYPTQKPAGIVRRMVAASSRPGGWCLDPFAGSGTLGAVCGPLGPPLRPDRLKPGGDRGQRGAPGRARTGRLNPRRRTPDRAPRRRWRPAAQAAASVLSPVALDAPCAALPAKVAV